MCIRDRYQRRVRGFSFGINMGNAPAPAPAANDTQPAMQTSLDSDVARIQTTYVARTDGESKAAGMSHRSLKRDDPKKFYSVQQELGSGAFGKVYKVTKKSNGRTFAMKSINTSAAGTTDEMIHREIGTMLQCNHPYLIGIEDVYTHNQILYIVMDLVEMPAPGVCPDLFSWIVERTGLGNRNATEEEVAQIIYRVASAIKYMNDEMGAIHRDLKPENVLVGPEGIENLKVTDFGLARLGVADDGFKGTFCAGTEGYMAPEVIDRSKVDADGKIFYGDEPYKVDVFSLGVLMFIIFTKTPPFGLGAGATRRIIDGNYDRNKMRTIPAEPQELIRNMIDINQHTRYSIEQVLAHPWLIANAGDCGC
eukprot:TRINITY_DN4265_c0_g2_i3.p1 TRINITY_DN4265_c0_g2~~TRINITY_DN4265_c0_g2_i3.p1  ORF type:complete len:365 (+),score=107.58 TRINITY_DN4265_c0_g2_i3:156-1250(+)